MAQPVKVFYCYASIEEDALLKLERQLKPLERNGLIETWHKRQILPGAIYAQEIEAHMHEAQVIILLISPAFLESEYCDGEEMARALQLQQEAKARVIPVLLDPCLWEVTPLKGLKPLPNNGRPISKWSNQGAAWFNVAEGIHMLVTDMLKQMEKEIEPRINETKNRSKTRQHARTKRVQIAETVIQGKGFRIARKSRVIELSGSATHLEHKLPEKEPEPVTQDARAATPEYDRYYDRMQSKINAVSFEILIWEPDLPTQGAVAEKRRDISRYLVAEKHRCQLGKQLHVPPGASLQDREIDKARDADLTVLLVEPLAIGEMYEFCKHEELLGKTFVFYPEELKSDSENWSLDKKLYFGYHLEYYQEEDIISCHVRTKVLNWVMARRSYRYSNSA